MTRTLRHPQQEENALNPSKPVTKSRRDPPDRRGGRPDPIVFEHSRVYRTPLGFIIEEVPA